MAAEEAEEQQRRRGWDPGRSFRLGAAANFFSTLATFPLHKTMFRQQLHATSIREAGRQLRQEGLRQFCRGLLPPLLAKTLQGTLLFGSYETFLHLLFPSGSHSWGQQATAGLLSGLSEGLVLGPFERVQNVLQDGQKARRFPTARSILEEFRSYGGLRERLALGYYRGLGLILLRNGLGSALYFSAKDPLRDRLREKGLPARLPALLSGCITGTAIGLLLYPLGVLIANIQAQVGSGEALGLRGALHAVWMARGGRAALLYRGASLLVLRSGLSWGLTTAMHDFLQDIT
ncbi:solute carrier family 25 member 53 [Anolis carolinensis]|nr:PREDICTED: solute carrier family 25 member 53 [Anolis carolinensis]|eukprot:XP_003228683.1 PREDICTED: solute carrier family 25 member 53 [Anolis carolinensis]